MPPSQRYVAAFTIFAKWTLTDIIQVEKKKKDPNAPKRGLSAYMFFAQDQRDNVREENPGISFGMIVKSHVFKLHL